VYFTLVLLSSTIVEAQTDLIWKGKSVGYEVRWTEANIQATSTDRKLCLMQPLNVPLKQNK
jgi:hypothetical protein